MRSERSPRSSIRLDEKERSRFYNLCFSFFRMFEDIHYQYVNGGLDKDVWAGYVRHYGAYAKAPGLQSSWKRRRETGKSTSSG